MLKLKNLATRMGVTVIGIPLAVFILFKGGWFLFTFVAILSIMANNEFFKLQAYPGGIQRIFMHSIQVGLLASAFTYRFDAIVIILLIAFIWNSNSLLLKRVPSFANLNNVSLASLIYPGLALASFLLLREFSSHSTFTDSSTFTLIILLLAGIWICDGLAYLFGSAFGETKIFPSVSPNKSWEGSLAGFLGSLTLMLSAHRLDLLSEFQLADYLVLAFISGILGQLGDLVESKYKRDLDVKDSSNILPGHGGIWDRLDSIAMAVPATWVYLYLRFVVF